MLSCTDVTWQLACFVEKATQLWSPAAPNDFLHAGRYTHGSFIDTCTDVDSLRVWNSLYRRS